MKKIKNANINPNMQPYQNIPPLRVRQIDIWTKVILTLFCFFAVGVIVLCLFSGCDRSESKPETPEAAAYIYAEVEYEKTELSDFKKGKKVTMLDKVYDLYDKDGQYEIDQSEHDKKIDDEYEENCRYYTGKAKKGKKMSDEALREAEEYFRKQAEKWNVDEDVVIEEGYIVKVEMTEGYEGSYNDWILEVYVVNVKGNGWKVIEIDDPQ